MARKRRAPEPEITTSALKSGPAATGDIRVPYGKRRSELEVLAVKAGVENAGSMTKPELEAALDMAPKPAEKTGAEMPV